MRNCFNRSLLAVTVAIGAVITPVEPVNAQTAANPAGNAAQLAVDALIFSGTSLTEMDLLTTMPLSDVGGGVAGSVEASAMALATIDPALNAALTSARAELSRRDAEASLREQQDERAEAVSAAVATSSAANAQAAVGPEGCPTSVPPNTLREGAADIGAAELCARSVAQSASPEAAQAIKYTFQNLGVPYSVQKRMTDGYYDCSSFVSKAYESAGVDAVIDGWALTTRQFGPYPGYQPASWLSTVAWEDRQPGDLGVTNPKRTDGGGHVVMILSDGYMIHTDRAGDVSHVTKEYSSNGWFSAQRAT